MKNRNNADVPTPSKTLHLLLNARPIVPRGTFWEAYNIAGAKGINAARKFLRDAYFTQSGIPKDSQRINLIVALGAGFPPTVKNLGWIEMFAIAGVYDAATKLVRSGQASAIHALHAEIELSPRFFPNPLLRASDEEMSRLLELYAAEAEILTDSAHSNSHVDKWLAERHARAVTYFETIEFCQQMRK